MALGIRIIDCSVASAADYLRELRKLLSPDGDLVPARGMELTRQVFGAALTPVQSVERICREVQAQGFTALQRYSRALDHFELTTDNLRVAPEELACAHRSVDAEFLAAVRSIRKNVSDYQSAILHRDVTLQPRPGAILHCRYRPLRRIGVCVPGGAAAYPSTLLMTVVPAQTAGVQEIAIVAPPTPFGANNAHVLATCQELGVTQVYRLGGAQAVAALAYGLEGLLAPVDMIVGPGNLFVALAKKYVFGDAGIDSIAGPSEVVILADETANPDWVAWDLIAQAEHSPGASILITWQRSLADAVVQALEPALATVSRGELARESLLKFGAIIVARDATEAVRLANELAPEHLHIQAAQANALAEAITNAGAIFLGPFAPVAVGDYAAGPSHVLPTGGTARFAHGLSANDFLKPTSVVHLDSPALGALAGPIMKLAEIEGLPAHANSVRERVRSVSPEAME